MKVLVTGASGFLGKKAMELFGESYEVVGTAFSRVSRDLIKMDITNLEEVKRVIKQQSPDVIFHTAAIVDVDLCEKDKTLARKVNVIAPRYLAKLCEQEGIKLVVISSDYIFSGENSPYSEGNAEAHPKSYYGYTKLMMERIVMQNNPNSLIIRIPILYGYNGSGTKGRLIIPTVELLKKGREIVIVDYRLKYPVLTDDVIRNAIILIRKNEKGIFNFATEKPLDRFKIATIVAKVFGLDKNLIKKGKPKKSPNKPTNVKLLNNRDKSLSFVTFEGGVRIVKQQMESMER